MTARWITADVFDGLATLEDGSVDLVVSSPPFLALRSYLPADHPDKHKEIGSEATPAEFIDVMLKVTAELRRVLAPHGSICVELGDTYAGTNARGPVDGISTDDGRANTGRVQDAALLQMQGTPAGGDWPLAKSRTLIPQLYEIALVYGINPLTGQPSPAGQWRIRNVVTWARPNPPVGALGDKWRPATSDLIVACVSPKRYWDDLATRKPFSHYTIEHNFSKRGPKQANADRAETLRPFETSLITNSGAPLLDYWEIPDPVSREEMQRRVVIGLQHAFGHDLHPNQGRIAKVAVDAMRGLRSDSSALDYWEIPLLEGEEPKQYGPKPPPPRNERPVQVTTNHGGNKESRNDYGEAFYNAGNEHGAPLLDYWEIPPGGYKGSHYAVFPEELVVPCVKAMCPPKVCRVCGEPSSRIVSDPEYVKLQQTNNPTERGTTAGVNGVGADPTFAHGRANKIQSTLGWSDCGHNDYRPGLVLDPFAGSGTTLSVATGHGHDAIGIDLDPRNADLARDRIGPFLFEETRML